MDQLTKVFLGAVAGAIAGCMIWSWVWLPAEDEVETEAEKLFRVQREIERRTKRP